MTIFKKFQKWLRVRKAEKEVQKAGRLYRAICHRQFPPPPNMSQHEWERYAWDKFVQASKKEDALRAS